MELGKLLADTIAPEMEADAAPKLSHDSSTNALIGRYRAKRRQPRDPEIGRSEES